MSLSVGYAYEDYGAGEFLLEVGVHAIDRVGYLFGTVECVAAFARCGSADGFAVSLTFTFGAVGTLTFSEVRSFDVPAESV